MPLTEYQMSLAQTLSCNRSEGSHLAGGAALNFAPNTKRFSNDLDYFHDSLELLAAAFDADSKILSSKGYIVEVIIKQPGYIRAIVSQGTESTKVEWAHDSAWRFMPAITDPILGYVLHPIDIAINKLLALAGRDEARDFLDILEIHRLILPLGALCWAAVGKDPGFTPLSLLGLIRRRGKYRPEDFSRLQLASEINLQQMKTTWLEALDSAQLFIESRPASEIGCLYYSTLEKRFVAPPLGNASQGDIMQHHGRPGGVLPKVLS